MIVRICKRDKTGIVLRGVIPDDLRTKPVDDAAKGVARPSRQCIRTYPIRAEIERAVGRADDEMKRIVDARVHRRVRVENIVPAVHHFENVRRGRVGRIGHGKGADHVLMAGHGIVIEI